MERLTKYKIHSLDAMIQQKIKRNLNESKHIETLKTTFFNVTEPEEELYNEFQSAYNQLQNKLNNLKNEKVFFMHYFYKMLVVFFSKLRRTLP